ncbi:MAG: phosphate transport system regulatory protein PhoU [Calditrichaeota bacterium]|nr:MAG: phosphate transport system regulatory protein PhoU [Calditrichota bacterium]
MKEKMQQLLENIKKDLIFLANQVEHSLRLAMKALERQDVALAEQVKAMDQDIDRLEVKIEDQILTLLALQQPVAVDLRFIIAALKMNNDLERIGDHAVNIAQTAIQFAGDTYLKPLEDLPRMNQIAAQMVHDAVSAFIHLDSDTAREICQRDSEVDELYDKVLGHIIQVVRDKPDKLEQAFALARVARDLERVADLATNLSEDVVFMKEAKIIRHHLEG